MTASKIPPEPGTRERIMFDLATPLDPARVRQRDAGRGRFVPYLEGFDIIAAANAILGFDGWSYHVDDIQIMTTTLGLILYRATVTVEALGVRRTDVGVGIVEASRDTQEDTPGAHETAIKGAATDALKRAFRSFGAQFGNDLYDKDTRGQQGQRGRQQAAPREQQKAEPAKKGPNTGDFMKWAHDEHKLSSREVCAIVGVEKPADIKDLALASAAVLARQIAAREEPPA